MHQSNAFREVLKLVSWQRPPHTVHSNPFDCRWPDNVFAAHSMSPLSIALTVKQCQLPHIRQRVSLLTPIPFGQLLCTESPMCVVKPIFYSPSSNSCILSL